MNAQRSRRTMLNAVLIGISLFMLIFGFSRLSAPHVHTIDMRAMVAEAGGWSPASFSARVGEPVRIKLTSGDMLHGFAIGQMDIPAVDVKPGETSEVTVAFDRPGKYVFYCTNWCGLGHWRMRGTIQVAPSPLGVLDRGNAMDASDPTPLYVRLGIDIDAPHPASNVPSVRPSASRGVSLGITLPDEYLSPEYYTANSPSQAWQALRKLTVTQHLSDADVWNLVAYVWESNTSAKGLLTGKQLFTANCAACHGTNGAGDGPMAAGLSSKTTGEFGSSTLAPTNFTSPTSMLGASPALLQGKIIRGGMGTGMPYWGPVFNDTQIKAIIAYLWTFQMEYQSQTMKQP
jgi:plastocyanin